ncbi:hypothetical protein [Methanothrix sp.]|uniref:hypothetical protein n=1 Tax=Methanothrix sp. TaxID=90426 RepID=UPI003BB67CFB
MATVNEGLGSDFFARMYPRLQPMSDQEYRNAPKRTTTAWDDVEDWRALQTMSPEESRRYCGGDGKR